MKCGKTGIYDDNGNELCTGDTVQQKYGHNIIIDPFGSQIPGAFTYHPEGVTNKTAHYLLADLKHPFTIVERKPEPVDFDPHWNKSTIQNLVKNNCYLDFGKHEDLKALCINEEDVPSKTRDYNEMVFFVPKTWLTKFCKNELNIKDSIIDWLQYYSIDESEIIFTHALRQRKIVAVDF